MIIIQGWCVMSGPKMRVDVYWVTRNRGELVSINMIQQFQNFVTVANCRETGLEQEKLRIALRSARIITEESYIFKQHIYLIYYLVLLVHFNYNSRNLSTFSTLKTTPVSLKSRVMFNYLDNKSLKGILGDRYMSSLKLTRYITPAALELADCQRAHWK